MSVCMYMCACAYVCVHMNVHKCACVGAGKIELDFSEI